jgi:hypothetical protein
MESIGALKNKNKKNFNIGLGLETLFIAELMREDRNLTIDIVMDLFSIDVYYNTFFKFKSKEIYLNLCTKLELYYSYFGGT